jgi:hypothetical protein
MREVERGARLIDRKSDLTAPTGFDTPRRLDASSTPCAGARLQRRTLARFSRLSAAESRSKIISLPGRARCPDAAREPPDRR